MTKQRKRARNATPTNNNNSGDSAKPPTCDICDNAVISGHHLQCNTCNGVFHPLCVNMSNDDFRVLQPILPGISWVCPACISLIREKRKSVDDQLQHLSTALHKLEVEHRSLVQKVDGLSIVRPPSATIVQPIASTSHAASAVTRDQQRRKRNIIISGLPELDQISDVESLRDLCECHLNYKPWLDDSKCQRIGKSSPRLLRVTLASEQAVTELLFAAKTRLSKSSDSSLRKIYFNRDLSPAEAEQAFLVRKERREGREGRQNALNSIDDGSVLNPLAQSFPTTSEGST